MPSLQNMNTQTFNTDLDYENLVDYFSLVFEDEIFPSKELIPVVEVGIQKGLEKYQEKDRDVNLFVYVTYFVKKEVNFYKNSKIIE
jgi:hypothetical protein